MFVCTFLILDTSAVLNEGRKQNLGVDKLDYEKNKSNTNS